MTGLPIETALELWAWSLRDVKARMRPLFTQERVAISAEQFLDGLLGEERRKTGWMRAEAAGDRGPWRQQAILGRGHWDADMLRDIVRDYGLETLSDPDAVLVIDETGFLKQGKASCGVGRQYTGSAGKITNCQIGVFASYVSRHGHAFIDRALYLPKAWTDDAERMAKAHVPNNTGFATKPALALAMIERALASNVPFSWVAADSVYGVGDIEMALKRAAKGYVLGVIANHPFRSWGKPLAVAGTAKDIAEALPEDSWQRLSAGDGAKGARLHDWVYLDLADLDAGDLDATFPGILTRGLLICRNIADGDLAFFSTWCPAGTSIETLVAVVAMAVETFAPDMVSFRNGRDFAAWLGLVPRQFSSGGKERLGRVTKADQADIRQMLIIGAMSRLNWMGRKSIPESSWLARMMARKPRMLVVIALANKMARQIWAMLTKNEDYKDPMPAMAA